MPIPALAPERIQKELFTDEELSGRLVSDVLAGLKDPRWDFRTAEGIAAELRIPLESARLILEELVKNFPELVRKSLVRDERGRELYTPRSRPIKSQERQALIRTILTKGK